MAELQAVVMAVNGGSRMQDITSSIPKPLLPVGNRPLLWYPLNLLERAGFDEVIVITTMEVRRCMPDMKIKLRVEVVCLPEDKAAEMGTADALRHIYLKIKRDVLVLSCDLITEVALAEVVNLFRLHNATLTMLMQKGPEPNEHVPGQKGKRKAVEERDFIGVDASGSRLLLLGNEDDLDDGLDLNDSIFQRYPRIRLRMGMKDAHLYCLRKYVLDFLDQTKSFSSIRRELIPFLISEQFTPHKDVDQATDKKDIYSYIPRDDLLEMALEKSSWNDHRGDMKGPYHGEPLRCYVHVAGEQMCFRVNSLPMYIDANKLVLQSSMFREENRVHPMADVTDKLLVGPDSLVGEYTKIGEKTTVKFSLVGANCVIKERVKITNCIIMNGVTIQDSCVLQGSILCNKVVLHSGADVKDCVLGLGQQIGSKEKRVNEVLMGSAPMMEV